jgi:hypothetical protein
VIGGIKLCVTDNQKKGSGLAGEKPIDELGPAVASPNAPDEVGATCPDYIWIICVTQCS